MYHNPAKLHTTPAENPQFHLARNQMENGIYTMYEGDVTPLIEQCNPESFLRDHQKGVEAMIVGRDTHWTLSAPQ